MGQDFSFLYLVGGRDRKWDPGTPKTQGAKDGRASCVRQVLGCGHLVFRFQVRPLV